MVKKNLINSAAHITGGGLLENIPRSIPDSLTANIDLSKIKTMKVFKWLKSHNISETEMLRTFNCGVGFCIIVDRKKINKIFKYFSNNFKPYVIGHISKSKKKLNLLNNIKW